MTPFETLYKNWYRFRLCSDEVGDRELVGSKFELGWVMKIYIYIYILSQATIIKQ